MNKSYDVYMCRERKQVFRVPINNCENFGDGFGYIMPINPYRKIETDMHLSPIKDEISWKAVIISAAVVGVFFGALLSWK